MSVVRFFFFFLLVFTSLVMAKNKNEMKSQNRNRKKKEHTKIHNIVLHLADGAIYIYFSVLLVVFFSRNVYVTPLSFLLVCGSLGCGCRAQVQPPSLSATFNSIKHSAITEVEIPQSLGRSHFF